MGKILFVIVLVSFCAVFRANALQCYQCRGCETVNSSLIVTCSARTTTTTSTTPNPAITNATTPVPATTNATTVAPAITNATTAAPASTNATTASPAVSNATTAAPVITNATTASPAVSNATTAAPAITNATTEAPAITNATTLAPAVTNSTTAEPAITNATTAATAITNGTTAAPAITNGTTAEPAITNDNYEVSYRGTRSLLQFREDEDTYSEPQCIETAYEENGVTNFIRDCYYAPEETEESTADQCRDVVGPTGTIVKCNICTTNLCNASGKATATITLIPTGLISALFYFKQ